VTFANVFQDRALVWCGVFAVCGSVLKCEEVYCIVLCCSILMNAANCDFFRMCIRIARWCVVLCCSVRRCIAVCVCGSVLHCIDVQYVDECNQLRLLRICIRIARWPHRKIASVKKSILTLQQRLRELEVCHTCE